MKELEHQKALADYGRTKDIIRLQKLLGHKNLSSTLAYLDRVQHGKRQ